MASSERRYVGKDFSGSRRERKWIRNTIQMTTADVQPSTRCISKIPFNFCPSNAHCHAASPVATTGTVKHAASNKLKYAAAARLRLFAHWARKSKATATVNSAMGKRISTTCCACLASRTVLRSNGFTLIDPSLHYDFAGHLWVNGAEIFIRAGFAESERKLLVGIQYFGFERFVGADGGMRNIVTIRPSDCRSHRNFQLRRSETEIVDLYFRRIGFLLRGRGYIPLPSAQTCEGNSKRGRKQNNSRPNSLHVFSLSFIWLLLWNFFVVL